MDRRRSTLLERTTPNGIETCLDGSLRNSTESLPGSGIRNCIWALIHIVCLVPSNDVTALSWLLVPAKPGLERSRYIYRETRRGCGSCPTFCLLHNTRYNPSGSRKTDKGACGRGPGGVEPRPAFEYRSKLKKDLLKEQMVFEHLLQVAGSIDAASTLARRKGAGHRSSRFVGTAASRAGANGGALCAVGAVGIGARRHALSGGIGGWRGRSFPMAVRDPAPGPR